MKDEELQQLAKEVRARDSTIKEIAEKLTETAEAAESAASAAFAMDDARRLAYAEIERLTVDTEKQLESFRLKVIIFPLSKFHCHQVVFFYLNNETCG